MPHHMLKAVREEAEYFELSVLVKQLDRLLGSQNGLDLSWLDTSGPTKGIRPIQDTRLAFCVAKNAYWDGVTPFDAPQGYKWATEFEYREAYDQDRKEILKP